MPDPLAATGFAALWDWRRQIAGLYAAVRALPPEAGWAEWQRQRDALFARHPQSPLDPAARRVFDGLPLVPYDPAYRFDVALQPATGPELTLDAGRDGPVQLTGFARTDGLAAALGGELWLFWIGGYGGGVFLPFADATSGRGSYGGGRYLLDTIKGADLGTAPDGRTVLDFNFAYNPSCSYSDRFVCPLSPAANRLTVAVRAGELYQA